ncbi:MAG: hypothetical protein ACF8NJ_10295 [Phycisphaerales bacterium JB038]
MENLADLIPELPRAFEVVEGELLQGETRMMIRFHVEGARGEDPKVPGWYSAPVRESIEVDGRLIHVAWWAVYGWPKVAAWAG